MKHLKHIAAAIAIGTVLGTALLSPASASHTAQHHDAGAPVALSEGEIKKVDKASGRLTIKHGPLARLEMPSMTMMFKVADARMLDQVKAGDRIRFDADNVKGKLTVTKMEVVR